MSHKQHLFFNNHTHLQHIFDDELLEAHKSVMSEMISRDRSRPSVVMWSIANEPISEDPRARRYFQVKTYNCANVLSAQGFFFWKTA